MFLLENNWNMLDEIKLIGRNNDHTQMDTISKAWREKWCKLSVVKMTWLAMVDNVYTHERQYQTHPHHNNDNRNFNLQSLTKAKSKRKTTPTRPREQLKNTLIARQTAHCQHVMHICGRQRRNITMWSKSRHTRHEACTTQPVHRTTRNTTLHNKSNVTAHKRTKQQDCTTRLHNNQRHKTLFSF